MLDNPRDLFCVSSAAVCMTPCRCTSLRTCASADGFRPSAGPSSNGRAEETRASLPSSRNPKVGQANGMELLKSSLSSGRKREQTVDGQWHAGQDPPSAETSNQRTQQFVANRTLIGCSRQRHGQKVSPSSPSTVPGSSSALPATCLAKATCKRRRPMPAWPSFKQLADGEEIRPTLRVDVDGKRKHGRRRK